GPCSRTMTIVSVDLPSTRYEDFVAAVRRHAPATLLPVLASESIKLFDGGAYLNRRDQPIFPWVIAAAARESIAYGNEHRSTPVRTRDLGQMRNLYTNLHDPFFDAVGQEGALDSLLVRVAFDQFPHQHSR